MSYSVLYLISISEEVKLLFLSLSIIMTMVTVKCFFLYIDGCLARVPILLSVLTAFAWSITVLIPTKDNWREIIWSATMCEEVSASEIKGGDGAFNLNKVEDGY